MVRVPTSVCSMVPLIPISYSPPDTATNMIPAAKKAEQYKCSLISKARAMAAPPSEYESDMSPTVPRLTVPALCPKIQRSPTASPDICANSEC